MSFEATIDDSETDSELETVLRSFGVQSFVPIAPWFRHLEGNDVDRWGNEIQLIDMTDDYAVSFAEELDPEDLDLLRAFPEIRYIAPVPETEFYFTPNDQYFEDQWYLENNGQSLDYQVSPSCDDTMIVADYDIDATSAWNSVLSPGCLIGLIDTGIRGSHEDLEDSFDPFLSESTDNCGHGTAVAGIMVAAGDNSVGVAGVARPDKDESSEKLIVLNGEDSCVPDPVEVCGRLAEFTRGPTLQGVKVVNESWGGPDEQWQYEPTWRDCHRNAYVAGLFVSAAAGNTVWCGLSVQDTCTAFPAGFNYLVTAVTGLDPDGDNQWHHGSWNDLAAGLI